MYIALYSLQTFVHLTGGENVWEFIQMVCVCVPGGGGERVDALYVCVMGRDGTECVENKLYM